MADRTLSGDTVPLYWPRDATFRDRFADVQYVGEGVYQVPKEHANHYKTRGWEAPDDVDDDSVTADDADDPELLDQHEDAGRTVDDADDSDDDADGGSGNESSPSDDGGDFNAEAFVRDGDYEDVVSRIQNGEADGHLDAVADAEADFRDRTSVKNAVDDRRD